MITGRVGFLVSLAVEKLVKERCIEPRMIISSDSENYDLRVCENCLRITEGIDIVIHLPAKGCS